MNFINTKHCGNFNSTEHDGTWNSKDGCWNVKYSTAMQWHKAQTHRPTQGKSALVQQTNQPPLWFALSTFMAIAPQYLQITMKFSKLTELNLKNIADQVDGRFSLYNTKIHLHYFLFPMCPVYFCSKILI